MTRQRYRDALRRANAAYHVHCVTFYKAREDYLAGNLAEDVYWPIRTRHQVFLNALDVLEAKAWS